MSGFFKNLFKKKYYEFPKNVWGIYKNNGQFEVAAILGICISEKNASNYVDGLIFIWRQQTEIKEKIEETILLNPYYYQKITILDYKNI